MNKIVANIAGVLLGLVFCAASIVVLFHLAPEPKLPEGSPMAMFMTALGTTGYMTFIKILELTGGILVAIPRTRCLGLLILGPIVVNILAFTIFIAHGQGLNVMTVLALVLSLYLLGVERKRFAPLITTRAQ